MSIETQTIMSNVHGALKVGLMVPSTNTTMEHELQQCLPADSVCVTARIQRGSELLTLETMPQYKAKTLALAATLASRGLDVLAYGCTAAGFMLGPAGDRQLAMDLEEVTGTTVVTTAQAMVLALQGSGAKNIALVTPYPDSLNKPLIAFLAESGISVKRFASFYAATLQELGQIEAGAVDALARATIDDDCDALFIACTQLPTFGIIDKLRSHCGRPVWSAIGATAWQVRRTIQPH